MATITRLGGERCTSVVGITVDVVVMVVACVGVCGQNTD
jgi:hypothetical protein